MKIERVRILNYKSYRDSGLVQFGPRATVLVGQNNAGKTAFLEALALREFGNKHYRGPRAENDQFPNFDPISRVQFDVSLSGRELLEKLLETNSQFDLPGSNGQEEAREIVVSLFASDDICLDLEYANGAWSSRKTPSFGSARPPFDSHIRIGSSPDRRNWREVEFAAGMSDSLGQLVGSFMPGYLYAFRAERMNVSECGIDASHALAPNAQNLASVLLQLAMKPAVQEEYRDAVREIFPTIFDVRSAPIQQSVAKITVINRDNAKRGWHPGIMVPLSDSGTGISQVLAILYVVLTAESPQIIVIDEPNSFLHPGAARKLVAILQRFQHQYIISTHSSEIVNAADPDILHLIRWNANASEVETLDRSNNDDQRRLLDELGVRLSDVFGADNVLWVEGLTEERCFPLLLAHQLLLSPGTSIVSLIATGDLESKRVRPELAFQIYERLSNGNALIPPALRISLDREGRTPAEIEDLGRRSQGLVEFLPRRTYENYLLHAEAVTTILITAMEDDVKPSRGEVEAWIRDHKFDPKYHDRSEGHAAPTEENWMTIVNAPKLLKGLFSQLSGATVEFTKPHHSMELTKWLLANEPGYLDELLGYVSSLVGP